MLKSTHLALTVYFIFVYNFVAFCIHFLSLQFKGILDMAEINEDPSFDHF
jgi:hypothetical protein